MITGSVVPPSAIVKKAATLAAESPADLGANNITASAPTAAAWRACAAESSGVSSEIPTTKATRLPIARATISTPSRRSSGVSVANSLAIAG